MSDHLLLHHQHAHCTSQKKGAGVSRNRASYLSYLERVTSEDEHEQRLGSGEHGRNQLPRKRTTFVLTELPRSNWQSGRPGVDTLLPCHSSFLSCVTIFVMLLDFPIPEVAVCRPDTGAGGMAGPVVADVPVLPTCQTCSLRPAIRDQP